VGQRGRGSVQHAAKDEKIASGDTCIQKEMYTKKKRNTWSNQNERELAVGGKCDGSSGRVLLARPIVATQREFTS
jgi:hypothetical protein